MWNEETNFKKNTALMTAGHLAGRNIANIDILLLSFSLFLYKAINGCSMSLAKRYKISGICVQWQVQFLSGWVNEILWRGNSEGMKVQC